MRLHSVRFKGACWTPEMSAVRADKITDLMILYGCYLERVFVMNTTQPHTKWVARYV